MTRDQQWVVLFLSLLLFLFFFLINAPRFGNEPMRLPLEVDLPPAKAPAGEFMVEVDGSVQRRGVYSIGPGLNVLDVIEKAGGIRGRLSLPAESLLVPVEKSCRLSVLPTAEGKGKVLLEPLAARKQKVLSVPIDINTASLEELDTLPGIGPITAQAIVEYRERQGKFTSAEDLLLVPGMGPKKLGAILPHVTVQRSR